MKVLIVDDELPARRRIRRILERIAGVEVIGEAADGVEASALIAASPPDLVLLDIDMPERDGVAVARAAPEVDVIFITAHAEHAVTAFDLEAIDYLLKPISEERLGKALERARARRGQQSPEALARAIRALLPAEPPVPRITANDGGALHIFDAREIERLTAANRYVVFHREGREYLLDESLNTLEERLGPHDFVRVHRAELVNLRRVRTLQRVAGGAELELESGALVPVSRRLLGELERRLGLRHS